MEFRCYCSHSGHNDGITRRGEGSENASLGGKWCLFSDPSPLRANQPNLQNGNVILMMWFYSFQRLFKIRMVITQLLCDEMVINSRNIDGFRWYCSHSGHNAGITRNIHTNTNRYQTVRLAPISVDYYEYTLQSWHNLLHPEWCDHNNSSAIIWYPSFLALH